MLPAKSYIGLVDLVSDYRAWSVTSPTGLVARKVFREDCHLVTKVRCMNLPVSDRGDFSCRRAVDSSS